MAKIQQRDFSKEKCCARMSCFKEVDQRYLKAQCSRVLPISQQARRIYLATLLDTSTGCFKFNGNTVCYAFLEKSFGFSRDMQGSVKGTPSGRKVKTANGNLPRESDPRKRDAVICFLERLAESTADQMPDKTEQHLPYYQKGKVYELFVVEYRKLYNAYPPSESYFYLTWSKHVPNIKVRKVHRFTVCTECETIRDGLAKAGTDESITAELRSRKLIHVRMVQAERREYQKKSDRACLYPSQFCSLIVDGADQSAFGLPHFLNNTKTTTGHSMKVRLVGVLEHAAVKILSLYTMTEEFETGANHIIEAIHRTLMNKSLKVRLPDIIYLQVDNCTRENKNRFLFAYLECFIAWGVFAEVYVSFLPIGHTHADIDQTFSCTARHLRNTEAVTIRELIEELGNSYHPLPVVSRMLHIINFSELCKKDKCLTAAKNFSQYRYFKFHRVGGEPQGERDSYKTGCCVKIGCGDEWAPLFEDKPGIGFLKFTPDLMKTPPTPATSPKDFEEICKRFRSEETRINSTSKMRELRELRDHVYTTRLEAFHWNLRAVFELRGRHSRIEEGSVIGRDADQATQTLDPEHGAPIDEDEIQEEPRTDLEYKVSEFVAVVGEGCTDDLPFWLGKVKRVHKNCDGVVVRLTVHWYEVYNKKDAFNGKYAPSYFHSSKKPWVQDVDVATVAASFAKLTRSRKIDTRAGKKIRSSLNIA